VRPGRKTKNSLATKANDVKEGILSCDQDKSTVAGNVAVEKQEDASVSRSDAAASAESTVMSSNLEQVLIDTAAVDGNDAIDISDAVTISSLENGTLYVLQPLESVSQNIGCQTLRLLGQRSDQEHDNITVPTVLVAASSADMISNSSDLAHLLQSAGITRCEPEPVRQAESMK